MPEFMVLIHESETAGAALAPRETRALLERQAAHEQTLRGSSAYVDGERLRPSAETKLRSSVRSTPERFRFLMPKTGKCRSTRPICTAFTRHCGPAIRSTTFINRRC